MRRMDRRISDWVAIFADPSLETFRIRAIGAFIYFWALVAAGSAWYALFEQWSFIDSLYMSMLTATAVGYGEVYPLSPEGRLFSIVLMWGSVIGLGVWWALITALLIEIDVGGVLRRVRMNRTIAELKDHFIICGAGRAGHVVVSEMERAGHSFVIIEQNHEHLEGVLREHPDVLVVEGDATKEAVLEAAGVHHADGLAACLRNDSENLLLCLTARGMCPDLRIVSRAYDQESLAKLRRAGADHAISPTVTGAVRIASTLLRPTLAGFLDEHIEIGSTKLTLEDAIIPAHSSLVGKSLAEAQIPQKTGLIVIALQRHDDGKEPIYNPGPTAILHAEDLLFVLGRREEVDSLRVYLTQ